MILAVDVHYSESGATAAGVVFTHWYDDVPQMELKSSAGKAAEYRPGEFFKRELPAILKLIEDHALIPDCIIVDGFVYLDGRSLPGLGRHLYDALGGKVPVIGVAKSGLRDIGREFGLYRGGSRKPLYITAAGIDPEEAKKLIRSMHGAFRLPTLLRRVDRLCRGYQRPAC
jgi:deoxyribonuclease V